MRKLSAQPLAVAVASAVVVVAERRWRRTREREAEERRVERLREAEHFRVYGGAWPTEAQRAERRANGWAGWIEGDPSAFRHVCACGWEGTKRRGTSGSSLAFEESISDMEWRGHLGVSSQGS